MISPRSFYAICSVGSNLQSLEYRPSVTVLLNRPSHNTIEFNTIEWFLFVSRFPSVQKWFATLPDFYLEMGKRNHVDTHKVNELIYRLIMMKQNACRENFTLNLNS